MDASSPSLELNGEPLRLGTFSRRTTRSLSGSANFDWNKASQNVQNKRLNRILQKCISDQAGKDDDGNTRAGGFVPSSLLHYYVDRQLIQQELREECCHTMTAQVLWKMLHAEGLEPEEMAGVRTYYVIFSLLALLGKIPDIVSFIDDDQGICDQDLPLKLIAGEDGSRSLERQDDRSQIHCLDQWHDRDHIDFDHYQWQLLVPFFALDENNAIQHQMLHDRTILPWSLEESNRKGAEYGGYSQVVKVRLHPLCHDFHDVLKAINVSGGWFAIKTLREKDDKKFLQEVNALKRFNGQVHQHLVTLLGTYLYKNHFSMIFPSAECDLELYWQEKNPQPDRNNIDFVRWVSKQCQGIMGAIDTIHNPRYPDKLPEQTLRYGRHGDIKPENFLWFKSPEAIDYGIWVLSDLGLTAFNREQSRSMIPNEKVGFTPGYRPPECDIEGGTISRSFDIWTLGCFYLEMICWLVGGVDLKEAFHKERTTPYIMGANKDLFFDLQQNSDVELGDIFVALVKHEVVQRINRLHVHPNATQFIHDLLDLIENEMLIVLSVDRPRRGLSGDLLNAMNLFHEKCVSNADYCMRQVKDPRIFRAPTGTEARLNGTARRWIASNKMTLKTYEPERPVHKSLHPGQLSSVDAQVLQRR